MKEATRSMEYTTEASLYLAFDLSKEKWKLGFSTGLGLSHLEQKPVDYHHSDKRADAQRPVRQRVLQCWLKVRFSAPHGRSE